MVLVCYEGKEKGSGVQGQPQPQSDIKQGWAAQDCVESETEEKKEAGFI